MRDSLEIDVFWSFSCWEKKQALALMAEAIERRLFAYSIRWLDDFFVSQLGDDPEYQRLMKLLEQEMIRQRESLADLPPPVL